MALAAPVLADPSNGLGVGWTHNDYPERACDWIEAHAIRGRALNVYWQSGYLLFRFYPDPGRLPFMDIHQAGTKEIRYLYAMAQHDTSAWRVLDNRFRFDWVLLPGARGGIPKLADFLRPAIRAIAGSPYNSRAHALAGNLALLEGRFADAREHFDEAARQHSLDTAVRDRQGMAHFYDGDLDGAELAFRAADRAPGAYPQADLRRGQLLAARGRRDDARRAYEQSLKRHPEITAARDSLASMGVR